MLVAVRPTVFVYALRAVKAAHHAAGQRSVVTITALLTFAEVLADTIGLFVEFKDLLTKHGADMMHGIIFHLDQLSVTDIVCQEHIAVNHGWAAN